MPCNPREYGTWLGGASLRKSSPFTTFTAGQQSTLPIWILSQLTRPRDRPVTNVVAFFVILITAVPIVLSYRLTRSEE